jgi:hypothetical protein
VKKIYLTHCSKEKDPEFALSGEKVTPDRLYTSEGIQQFIKYCNEHSHYWAILSDRYGVVFRDDHIKWYNQPPDTVTEEDYERLLQSFITRLSFFDEVYFYHRPGETHPLFARIVEAARALGMKVNDFTQASMQKGE